MINGFGGGHNGNGKPKNGNALRIVTHEGVYGRERAKRIGKCANEKARGLYGKKPSWFQKRTWGTSNEDKALRYGRFNLPVPGWLSPAAITWSVTASVVWGLCGVRCVDHEEA